MNQQLIQAVKDHALKHYNEGGWDYIVECYSDEDIAREIGKARTPKGAIRKVAEWAKLHGDQRAEIRAEIW